MIGQAFAWLMVGLQVCACIGYAVSKDWKHAMYWFFAAGITLSVTI